MALAEEVIGGLQNQSKKRKHIIPKEHQIFNLSLLSFFFFFCLYYSGQVSYFYFFKKRLLIV